MPSLVVVGADDTPFLIASDYMSAKIPGARKLVIPRARPRAANIDQPEAFNTGVLGFPVGPWACSASNVSLLGRDSRRSRQGWEVSLKRVTVVEY